MIDLNWTSFEAHFTGKSLTIQYIEADDRYYIWAFDGPMSTSCQVYKDGGADVIDFETNHKANANTNLWQYDSDGAQVVRVKAAKRGWTYKALGIEFETARLSNSVYCKDSEGTDVSGITLKAYNSSLAEVTVPGLLDVNLATITQTVIDFEPTYDYEVIGGSLRTETSITNDIRLWIVAVPDIPAEFGGSKEMAVCINMKYLSPGNVYEVDGRVSKLLKYDAVYHTNKLRLIFKYPAGTHEKISIMLEYYKE